MAAGEGLAVKIRQTAGFAVIDLLFVCGIIGILSGIALPRLMVARGAAQSASAVASMRVIGSSQVAFAITCGSGFYAPSLTTLAKPPVGTNDGFVEVDLGSADTVVKSAYTIQMISTPFGGAPDTCNALGPGVTGQAFKAAADPLDIANNVRYFAVNAGNAIWEDRSSLWGSMPEFGDPATGFTLR
jgi:type II secretory pathway pseudopilin PulG